MYQLSQTWLEKLQVKETKKQEIFKTCYVLHDKVISEEKADNSRGIIPAVLPRVALMSQSLLFQAG